MSEYLCNSIGLITTEDYLRNNHNGKALLKKIQVLQDVTPCQLVNRSKENNSFIFRVGLIDV
jgi:hypothetical protein